MHALVQNLESTVETACASIKNARCVCVWVQDFAAFLSALQPVLERASYAFAKIVLICQGSSGFQAQVRLLLAACQHCDKPRCCAAAAATVNCAGFVHMVALTLRCAWLQVLCSMSQLLAVGQSYGLRLQCFTSTSTAATEVGGQELAQGVHADSWGMGVQHPAPTPQCLHRSTQLWSIQAPRLFPTCLAGPRHEHSTSLPHPVGGPGPTPALLAHGRPHPAGALPHQVWMLQLEGGGRCWQEHAVPAVHVSAEVLQCAASFDSMLHLLTLQVRITQPAKRSAAGRPGRFHPASHQPEPLRPGLPATSTGSHPTTQPAAVPRVCGVWHARARHATAGHGGCGDGPR